MGGTDRGEGPGAGWWLWQWRRRVGRGLALAALLVAVSPAVPAPAQEAATLDGREVMRRVDARDEGDDLEWELTMTLIDRRGQERTRTARLLRRTFEVEQGRQERQVTVFLSPGNIRNVGLLTFDYKDVALDDDVWLYLPALRRLRRIPASERGDNFVGTDFTYEDVKGGFAVADYEHRLLGEESWQDGGESFPVYRVESRPKTPELVRALGFARTEILVRSDIFLRVYQEFYDESDNLDRVMTARRIEQIDGIWTFRMLEAHDLETDHRTVMEITTVRYNQGLPDHLFEERALTSESLLRW